MHLFLQSMASLVMSVCLYLSLLPLVMSELFFEWIPSTVCELVLFVLLLCVQHYVSGSNHAVAFSSFSMSCWISPTPPPRRPISSAERTTLTSMGVSRVKSMLSLLIFSGIMLNTTGETDILVVHLLTIGYTGMPKSLELH